MKNKVNATKGPKGLGSRGDKLPTQQSPPKRSTKKAERYLRDTGKIEDLPDNEIRKRK